MMNDNSLELAEQLIQRAKEGDHSKFEFIRSLEEYFAAKMIKKALKKVVKSFSTPRNNLYIAYIKDIEEGTNDLNVILAFSELEQVIKFYNDEIGIISDMVDEYVTYVHSGHILDTIIGNYRKEEDLVDFRKVEWYSGE